MFRVDTREAAARRPPDLPENKTAANDAQAEVRPGLIAKPSGGAARVVGEAVACPVLTHPFAGEVLSNPITDIQIVVSAK